MASTPKPIREEAKKFGNKIKEAVKKHPNIPSEKKTSKHLKTVKNFNETEKKRVMKIK